MRIVYLIDEDLETSKGVARKIESQLAVWRMHGNEVHLVGTRSPQTARGNPALKIAQHFRNCHVALETIKDYAPDLIYTRYIKYAPFFAKKLSKIAPYVVEINTNDVIEFGLKNAWHGLYNRLTRSAFLKRACAFISVTNELAQHRDFSRFRISTNVIGNGYAFPAERAQHEIGIQCGRHKAVFVGSPQMPWHGVDKVARLARMLPEFDFHIVGPSREELPVPDRELPNLIWHGELPVAEADKLMALSHVGISTLALHRNGMKEACPLKSRQYLSHGLPTIVGYKDPDLHGLGEWILELPNEENSVEMHISHIRSFIAKSHDCNRELLFERARERLDSVVKERLRLTFIDSAARRSLGTTRD
jgi:hypothetical protein